MSYETGVSHIFPIAIAFTAADAPKLSEAFAILAQVGAEQPNPSSFAVINGSALYGGPDTIAHLCLSFVSMERLKAAGWPLPDPSEYRFESNSDGTWQTIFVSLSHLAAVFGARV